LLARGSSVRIDFVSQNSAVHHHRDHDDIVRPHAEIGAPLRERKEAQANRSAPLCVSLTNVPLSCSSSQPRSIASLRPPLYSAGVPLTDRKKCDREEAMRLAIEELRRDNR
jgi:hypothetical protein